MPVTYNDHSLHVCEFVHARTFARACMFKTQHTTAADVYYATRQGLFFENKQL
jgi:hypothetical protein